MKILFIFLCKNHHWHEQPNEDYLKYIIPFITLFIGFGFSWYIQYTTKKENTKERLSNDIIDTCDKMIRYANSALINILSHRYYYRHSKVVSDPDLKKESNDYSIHYHKRAEEAYLKYDLLKSDLKKNVKDLKIYWDEKEANKIIEIMSETIAIGLEHFMDFFTDEDVKDIPKMYKKFMEKRKSIDRTLMLEGVGFNLVRIEKIIDPESPSMFADKELEQEIMNKINNLNNSAQNG